MTKFTPEKLGMFLLASLVSLLIPTSTAGQSYSKIQGWAEQGGLPVTVLGSTSTTKWQQSYPSCTISVFNSGTVVLASIFSDNSGTPKANPFTADSNSYWYFYGIVGTTYDVRFSGTGITTPFTLGGFTAGGGGGSSISIGTINSQVKSSNGLVITGGSLVAQTADASFPGLVSTTTQTIAGVKTLTNPPTLISTPVGDPGQGNTNTALTFRGADSSSGSPSSSVNPSTYLQTLRTGQSNGTPIFGFLTNFQLLGSAGGDTYANYYISRISPDMTGLPVAAYYHDALRSYILLNPTNIVPGQAIAGYAAHIQAERNTSGFRIMPALFELRNASGSDANVSTGSADSTFAYATSYGGDSHNTGLWFIEGQGNSTAAYFGIYAEPNSLAQRVLDFSQLSFTLQGTWAATNGSATVTGTNGHAGVEVVAGDYLTINGTVARAASATANSITLTSTFSGSTGSSLTITKPVQFAWLRNNQTISSYNAAGSSRYELARLNPSDIWTLDADSRGITFGSYATLNTTALTLLQSTPLITGAFGGVQGMTFQSSTLNSSTRVSFIPNGASGSSDFIVWAGSNTASAAYFQFQATAAGHVMNSGFTAGGVQPLSIQMQGVTIANFTTSGIFSSFKGADVASAATITPTGNLFHVTGVTTITSVSGTGITAGTTITLIFDSTAQVTDGSNLKLAGNFTGGADRTLTLKYDGSNWFEIARSTN